MSGRGPRPARAFTLIELILVMAILTMAVSMTAPMLSRFFRGRILDSEARRLLALTRQGQNRAVSEGLPMDLWVNPDQGKFGLEAEPSYEQEDPRKVELVIDQGLQFELDSRQVVVATNSVNRNGLISIASVPRVMLVKPGLPTIRFLPDGTIGENSPQALRLKARDGSSLWLRLSRTRLTYEIASTQDRDTER